jgi:hypothetical protein
MIMIEKNSFLACLIVLLGALIGSNWITLISFIRAESYHCQNPRYDVRIISYHPLLIHLENFIAASERTHLLTLAYVFPLSII